jgi:hypothetical protein
VIDYARVFGGSSYIHVCMCVCVWGGGGGSFFGSVARKVCLHISPFLFHISPFFGWIRSIQAIELRYNLENSK